MRFFDLYGIYRHFSPIDLHPRCIRKLSGCFRHDMDGKWSGYLWRECHSRFRYDKFIYRCNQFQFDYKPKHNNGWRFNRFSDNFQRIWRRMDTARCLDFYIVRNRDAWHFGAEQYKPFSVFHFKCRNAHYGNRHFDFDWNGDSVDWRRNDYGRKLDYKNQ